MKRFLLVLAFMLLGSTVSAQAWNGKGDQKFQIGFNGWGYGNGLTGSYDYGLGKIVSIGAGVNVYFDGYKDNNEDNKVFAFGRLGFHLQEPLSLPENWDIYPGVNLGILGKDFGLGAYLGVRYFFNNKVGIYGEFGNNGSLGVSFNF